MNAVIQKDVEIRTADGVSDGALYRDESDRRLPGVLLLTDLGGIREATHEMARRVAAEEYTVLMPNVFYRTGRLPLFDSPPTSRDERTMNRFRELAAPMTPEAMTRDGEAYVNFLAAHSGGATRAVAVVGYCFTGAMALRIAAAKPDAIAAAASFHGGNLVTDAATSPHLVLPQVKARLYFGHATDDRTDAGRRHGHTRSSACGVGWSV